MVSIVFSIIIYWSVLATNIKTVRSILICQDNIPSIELNLLNAEYQQKFYSKVQYDGKQYLRMAIVCETSDTYYVEPIYTKEFDDGISNEARFIDRSWYMVVNKTDYPVYTIDTAYEIE